MRLEDLKKAKDRRPFVPFAIRTSDGRELAVSHPDAIAWEGPEFAPTLIVVLPGGGWDVINFAAITSLGIMPASRPRRKGGAK